MVPQNLVWKTLVSRMEKKQKKRGRPRIYPTYETRFKKYQERKKEKANKLQLDLYNVQEDVKLLLSNYTVLDDIEMGETLTNIEEKIDKILLTYTT